jgi:hypothetical protein
MSMFNVKSPSIVAKLTRHDIMPEHIPGLHPLFGVEEKINNPRRTYLKCKSSRH